MLLTFAAREYTVDRLCSDSLLSTFRSELFRNIGDDPLIAELQQATRGSNRICQLFLKFAIDDEPAGRYSEGPAERSDKEAR